MEAFNYYIKLSENLDLYVHFDEESFKGFNELLQVLLNTQILKIKNSDTVVSERCISIT